jgi:phage shock protein E
MKKLIYASLLLSALLILASCAPAPDTVTEENEQAVVQAEYIKISAVEAKALIDSEEVIILDVRTREEFEESRIEGALLIPDYEIKELAEELLPDKEATILVYCRTGRRSELASRALIEMGYQYVYDFGGIVDWEYETVSGK